MFQAASAASRILYRQKVLCGLWLVKAYHIHGRDRVQVAITYVSHDSWIFWICAIFEPPQLQTRGTRISETTCTVSSPPASLKPDKLKLKWSGYYSVRWWADVSVLLLLVLLSFIVLFDLHNPLPLYVPFLILDRPRVLGVIRMFILRLSPSSFVKPPPSFLFYSSSVHHFMVHLAKVCAS
jgi:hypothetical protein